MIVGGQVETSVRRPGRLIRVAQTLCMCICLLSFAGHLIALGVAGTELVSQRDVLWSAVTFGLVMVLVGSACWLTTHPGVALSLQWAMVNVLALSCAVIRFDEVEEWMSFNALWAAPLALVPPVISVAVSRQPVGWKATGAIFLPSFAIGAIFWSSEFDLDVVLDIAAQFTVLVVLPIAAIGLGKRQPRLALIVGSLSAVVLTVGAGLYTYVAASGATKWALLVPLWSAVYLTLWVTQIRKGRRLQRTAAAVYGS